MDESGIRVKWEVKSEVERGEEREYKRELGGERVRSEGKE